MKNDSSIETLRTLAVILIVSYHLLNDRELSTVKVYYNYLSLIFQYIRLPIFTVISGYLFGHGTITKENYGSFIIGKFRRIYVPMCFVAFTEYICINAPALLKDPSQLKFIWRIFVLPYEHYWFIQSMFLIFVIVGFIEAFILFRNTNYVCFLVAASLLTFFVSPASFIEFDVLSIGGASYILPYFLLGYILSKYKVIFELDITRKMIFFLFIASMFFINLVWLDLIYLDISRRSLIGLVLGITSCIFVLSIRLRSTVLATIGKHVFAIYLFQSFGASIGRRIGRLLLPLSPHLYFLVAVLVTVIFGCVVSFILSKNRVTAFIFLGHRFREKVPASYSQLPEDGHVGIVR